MTLGTYMLACLLTTPAKGLKKLGGKLTGSSSNIKSKLAKAQTTVDIGVWAWSSDDEEWYEAIVDEVTEDKGHLWFTVSWLDGSATVQLHESEVSWEDALSAAKDAGDIENGVEYSGAEDSGAETGDDELWRGPPVTDPKLQEAYSRETEDYSEQLAYAQAPPPGAMEGPPMSEMDMESVMASVSHQPNPAAQLSDAKVLAKAMKKQSELNDKKKAKVAKTALKAGFQADSNTAMKTTSPPKNLKVGMTVQALDPFDGTWSNAKIKTVASKTVTVMFVKSGEIAEVGRIAVRVPSQNMDELRQGGKPPAQANKPSEFGQDRHGPRGVKSGMTQGARAPTGGDARARTGGPPGPSRARTGPAGPSRAQTEGGPPAPPSQPRAQTGKSRLKKQDSGKSLLSGASGASGATGNKSRERLRAIDDYDGDKSQEELSFVKGDVLLLLSMFDENWAYAVAKGGAKGYVPIEWFKKLPPAGQAVQKRVRTRLRAIDDYEGDKAMQELSFANGDIMILLSMYDDNWAHVLGQGGAKGYVPIEWFEKLPPSAGKKEAFGLSATKAPGKRAPNSFRRDPQSPGPRPRDWAKAGATIDAVFEGDGYWYEAKLEKILGEGRYMVAFDDFKGPTQVTMACGIRPR